MADKKHGFDSGLVRNLADILNETDLTEIEVEQGDLRVRVSREPAPQIVSQISAAAAAPAPASTAPVQPAATATPEAASAAPTAGHEVPAPMVGTVYFSPAPGERPFVSVGDEVKEGDTLLIIEAMKVMNQIASPRSGKVLALRVEDGDPVEFGQPLLVIE